MDNPLRPELPKEIEPATPAFILQTVGGLAKIAVSPAGIQAIGVAVQTVASYARKNIVCSVYDRLYANDEKKLFEKHQEASNGCSSRISRAVNKATHNLGKRKEYRESLIATESDISNLKAMKDSLVSEQNPSFNQGPSHGQKEKY